MEFIYTEYYVYIQADDDDSGRLYVGITEAPIPRGDRKLVYYEKHDLFADAVMRVRLLRNRSREENTALAESMNPEWKDLYGSLK